MRVNSDSIRMSVRSSNEILAHFSSHAKSANKGHYSEGDVALDYVHFFSVKNHRGILTTHRMVKPTSAPEDKMKSINKCGLENLSISCARRSTSNLGLF